MPVRIPQYVPPTAAITDPYYGDYSALAQQYLRDRNRPVYSVGAGLANIFGDLGEAYFEKSARKDAEKQQAVDNADIAKAIMEASQPRSVHETETQQGIYTPAQSAFPGGQAPVVPGAGGPPTGPMPVAQPAFNNAPATAQQRAIAALSGVNPRVMLQALPLVSQAAAASETPTFTGTLKEGEHAFVRGKDVAAAPPAVKKPDTVTTAAGVFVLNPDGSLGSRLGDVNREQEPLVQIPDPNNPGQSIYVPRSQAVGKNAFQTPRERSSKMQTYWGPDGSFQQLDSNDPEDQKTIKALGLVTAAPSDAERTAKGFLDRMQESKSRLENITAKGFDPSNLADNKKAGIPLVGNYMVSDNYQQYRQAAEDWVRAKLRKESGAVIGPKEMEDEIKTYFPQPGDSPETQKNKEKSRRQAERQMATGAGILGRTQLSALDAPQVSADDVNALLDKYAPRR